MSERSRYSRRKPDPPKRGSMVEATFFVLFPCVALMLALYAMAAGQKLGYVLIGLALYFIGWVAAVLRVHE